MAVCKEMKQSKFMHVSPKVVFTGRRSLWLCVDKASCFRSNWRCELKTVSDKQFKNTPTRRFLMRVVTYIMLFQCLKVNFNRVSSRTVDTASPNLAYSLYIKNG